MRACICEHMRVVPDHGVGADTPISVDTAKRVARVMSALSTASRVRILTLLRQGPCSVGELTTRTDMAQPSISQQLRVLRDVGLVVGRRQGRHTVYGLYDAHVRSLLDETLRHVDHRALGQADSWDPETGAGHQLRRSSMTEQHTHETAQSHELAHEHDGETHEHPHTTHDHEHVEHEHEHEDGDTVHAHPHVHQAGQEEDHLHPADQ